MANDLSISDGLGGTVIASTRELDDGSHGQDMTLLRSDVTTGAYITADASGLLVNLGANNDVTLASGTLTAIAGTVTTSIAGTPTVSISGGTTVFSGSLGAGTERIGYVGISSDGTAIADMLSLTNGTAVAVGLYDSDGSQLTFASPIEVSATPSILTSAYSANTNLDTDILSFAGAAATDGGSGWITKLVVIDKDGEGAGMQFFFLDRSITPPTEGSAFSLSDGTAVYIQGVVDTATGTWFGYGGGSACQVVVGPPIPYKLNTGTTLYAVAKVTGTPTYTAASDIVVKVHLLRD